MKATEGQSVFDIAIERLGSAEAAFSLAIKNGLSVTDELTPGQSISLIDVVDAKVTDYFTTRNIVPATALGDIIYHEPPVVVVTVVGSTLFVNDSIVKANDGQSLFDIAIERLGSAEAAFSLAIKNGLSVTDELTPGKSINLIDIVDQDVTDYFTSRNIKPATTVVESDEGDDLANEGIGYWAIGVDFIVS